MKQRFAGRHYETGTVINALDAMGVVDPKTSAPYSEALALGASGGIAFGYFVFEYTGHLPHVALLARNTISPFERMLDNLAIRRETRETTDAKKGEENLRRELDMGNAVIVWADIFSLPYRGLDPTQMWAMLPMLVVGHEGGEFLVVDSQDTPIRVSAKDLSAARGRVKKDRHRLMVLEPPDDKRLPEGLLRGIETCVALFLDKPPVGAANNWGIQGMRFWAKMLTENRNAKAWARQFEPGARLSQALAGCHGQPGVWDWIETWGTNGGADRGTYAGFLREASAWLGNESLLETAETLDRSAVLWGRLAEAAMPDSVPEFARLKELKREHAAARNLPHEQFIAVRHAVRQEMRSLVASLADASKLAPVEAEIRASMAAMVGQIADLEESAMRELRGSVAP
jgi:hypothetical protein